MNMDEVTYDHKGVYIESNTKIRQQFSKSANMKSFTTGLLLFSVALMSAIQEGSAHFRHRRPGGRPGGFYGSHFGRPGGHGFGSRWCDDTCYNNLWTATGEVPNKLAQVPASPLYMSYNGRMILPNTTVNTEEMVNWPTLRWEAERGSLYTIFLCDFGMSDQFQYIHWMVSNVASGFSIGSGDEVSFRPGNNISTFNPFIILGSTVCASLFLSAN